MVYIRDVHSAGDNEMLKIAEGIEKPVLREPGFDIEIIKIGGVSAMTIPYSLPVCQF